MKQLLTFLKTTLLGGVLLVLPAWLAVLLLLKALLQLQVFVKPVASHMPAGFTHPAILAILLLVAVCFLVGLVIRTAMGAHVKRAVEKHVLDKLPGYTTLRGFAGQLTHFESTDVFKPALIEITKALAPGFLIEQLPSGRCTVFIPSVPTPLAGSIYIIARERVHELNVPVTAMMKCISKWGAGGAELVASLDTGETPAVKATQPTGHA